MADNYFIYIPQKYRQRNFRASCVFASVSNCMRIVGLWKEADRFWSMYRGDPNGENSWGISQKLTRFGVKHMVVHDEQSLINSLKVGRGAAVTFGGAHCVTLIGKINNIAYLWDNSGPRNYTAVPWAKFMGSFRSSGQWAVIILDGNPPQSV